MIETIYALASAPGRGGVAVIRVSGPAAVAALQSLTRVPVPAPRMAACRTLYSQTNDQLDAALVLYFAAPASFTGEDVVELHVHGGRAVIEGVLDALGTLPGLRLAEPGEFTRRAFENDRLDLTAAEAIHDLVVAETTAQRAQALDQMGGTLARLYDGWRGQLLRVLAHTEADIDFPDEDLPPGLTASQRPVLDRLIDEITGHLNDHRRGEMLRDGVQIVILGAPNAGKSSLLNALAQRDVAIVSDMAGTTRDIIEVRLDLGGYPVIIADTAGLRDTAEMIEAEGIRRARHRADNADLQIWLIDASQPIIPPEFNTYTPDRVMVIANKSDIGTCDTPWPTIPLSVKTGDGMDAFLTTLTTRIANIFSQNTSPAPTRTRHRAALAECLDHLYHAQTPALATELVAENLRRATRALARITGRVDVEDLLDVIFRDFCIGK